MTQNIPMRARAGFSLIEIIVALAIVATMATVAFQAFRYIASTKIAKAEAILMDLRMDIERFYSDGGRYPDALQDLITKPSNAKSWRGPYRDALPDDSWGHPLEYAVNAKGAEHPYELYSWGKNGPGAPEGEWISVWRLQ